MSVGIEWLIDAEGCDPAPLTDVLRMRALLDAVVAELDLRVLGQPHWHRFPAPGGVTGLYLLTESHLACHTYPEHGVATFNLYCCRERPPWPWERTLREAIGARRVRVEQRARGAEVNASDHLRREPAT